MKCHLFLLLFLSYTLHAQVAGIVSDAQTGKPLAFATVSTSEQTVLTDSNGKFLCDAGTDTISVSLIGYTKRNLPLPTGKYIRVSLTRTSVDQSVFNGMPIIDSLLRYKARNELSEFDMVRFKSYDRKIITAHPDSVDGRIDTIYRKLRRGEKFKIDSSDYKFKTIVEKQHLFQIEKSSEVVYANGEFYENVIATKMAGFRNPVYELYAFNMMSFSLYREPLVIFGTKYANPLAQDGRQSYHFRLLDTLKTNGRDTYIVHFSPKKPNSQSAVEGVYFIDVGNFGVAKAIISVRGMIDITAEHTSLYFSNHNKYLPTKISVKIVKGDNDEEIKILGETLSFAATPIDAGSPRYASDFAYLLSETTFYDYSSFVDRNFTTPKFSIVIPQEAIQKDDEFWMQNRPSPLDSRSLHTYAALDSIAQSAGVERKLLLGRKVINGYVPVGFFDVDLRYLASFNNYEGFRLGFGGKTNDRFSKKFRLEGYTAYGTKDGEFKYQLGGSVRVGNTSDTWIGLSYTDDIREIASTNFAVDKRTYKIYDPRPINVSTFYNYVSWRAYAQTRIIPAAETIWQFSHNLIRPQFNYAYLHDGQYYRNFSLTAAMVSIQWNPFSDFMQTPDGIIESEKRFPKFTFQFTQAIPNVMGNDLEFGKIEIRTAYEKKFLNQHKFSALFEAGRAYGNLPITHAYNTSPNNLDKDRLLQRVTFAGKDSFETMYFNEFFSDRFAFTQFKYAFGRLMISDKIKPTPVLATRMVWGAIDNRDKHIGINFNTLNHGYYESGIELNGIFKGLGLSAFYRYGAYHLPDLEDNIAVKLSFVINIGF